MKSELHYCNNCGRRVRSDQSELMINTMRGKDYYHETWEGCYESTRENPVFMTKHEREMQQIAYVGRQQSGFSSDS